ncbi:MAG: hypothetical protein ACE5F1_02410 [Planctomycetota bacterium]
MSLTPRTPSSRQLALLFLLPFTLVALVALLQGRILPLGDDWKLFIDFDRIGFVEAIRSNSQVEHGTRFRPFCYGHVWIERSLLGLPFWVCKWIGHLYLGLSGSMLVLLLLSLGLPFGRALLAGLLLAAHPAATEVHGWATARVDTMAACYGLLALWLGATRNGGVLTFLAFLAAFLSKESAYPLLLLPPLLAWAGPARGSRMLAAWAPALLAFAVTAALKLLLVGRFLAEWWSVAVPLGLRIQGYLSHARALVLWPGSSAAPGVLSSVLALVYAAALLGGMLVAPFLPRVRGRVQESPGGFPLLALLAAFVLSLAVTGGIAMRSDLGGSRVWFLPSAFLLGIFAGTSWRPALCLALPAGLLLLHLNLSPYREATRRMGVVLDRLELEVPARERAVRISGLEELHGPVPLFFHMDSFYLLRPVFASTELYDRPLLTRRPIRPEHPARIAALDSKWRAWMRSHGRKVLDLSWDSERGELRATDR